MLHWKTIAVSLFTSTDWQSCRPIWRAAIIPSWRAVMTSWSTLFRRIWQSRLTISWASTFRWSICQSSSYCMCAVKSSEIGSMLSSLTSFSREVMLTKMLSLPLRRLKFSWSAGHGLGSGLSSRKSSCLESPLRRENLLPCFLYNSALPWAIGCNLQCDVLLAKSFQTNVKWLKIAWCASVLLPRLPRGEIIGQFSHSCSRIISLTMQFVEM